MPAVPSENWSDFSGTIVRLVLPNVLVFPYSVQALKVTQPDAVAVVVDALSKGGFMALAVARDPVAESLQQCETAAVGCLARITAAQELAEGGYLLLLQGLARLQFEPSAVTASTSVVFASTMQDRYPSPAAIDRQRRRDELIELSQAGFKHSPAESIDTLARQELSLGCLCDVIAQGCRCSTELAVELLSVCNVDYRSDLLLDHLRIGHRGQFDYPPAFSNN